MFVNLSSGLKHTVIPNQCSLEPWDQKAPPNPLPYSVGYGDIVCDTQMGRVVQLLSLLVGLVSRSMQSTS